MVDEIKRRPNRVKNKEIYKYNGVTGIYVIENVVTKQVYVGSAKCLGSRLRNHFWDLKANRHHNRHLQNSYNKYGEECFTFYVELEYTDIAIEDAKLRWIEDLVIDDYNSDHRDYGFNIIREGFNNRSHSDETKRKLSTHFLKPILSYNIKTGEITKYESIKQASSGSRGLASAIKRSGSANDCFWFYDGTLCLERLKTYFIKKNKVRKLPTISHIVLDLETGIYYDSVREFTRHIGIDNDTFRNHYNKGRYTNKYLILK
jgi:group I intron endonuclease